MNFLQNMIESVYVNEFKNQELSVFDEDKRNLFHNKINGIKQKIKLKEDDFKISNILLSKLKSQDCELKLNDILYNNKYKNQLEDTEFTIITKSKSCLITALDLDFNIVKTNKLFRDMIGINKGDLIGTSIYDYLPKENEYIITNEIISCTTNRDERVTYATEIFYNDNKMKYYVYTDTLSNEDNKVFGFLRIYSKYIQSYSNGDII